MSDDATINVGFGAQITGLLGGLKEAGAAVTETVNGMKATMATLAETAESLLGPFLAIAALVKGGEMFEHMIEDTATLATQLEILNQKTGMDVEQLSALKYAAEQTHVSFDDLGIGLQRLSRAMEQAAKGTAGPATEAFQSLGIKVADASGHLRPMQDVLLQLADKFQTMHNGATKTALAMDLFGRSGANLIPLLNRGKAGIAELEAEAARLGVTMSEKDVEAAVAYEDAMKRMHAALSGLGHTIAVAIMPTLALLAEGLTALILLLESAGNAILGIADAMVFNFVGAADRFKKALDDIKSIKDVFNPVANTPAGGGSDDGPPIAAKGGPTRMDLFQHEWEKLKNQNAQNFGELTALELKFWQGKLAAVEKGSKDYLAIYRKVTDLTERTLRDSYDAGVAMFRTQEEMDKENLAQVVKDREAELQFIRNHYKEVSKEVQEGIQRVIDAQHALEKESRKTWANLFNGIAGSFKSVFDQMQRTGGTFGQYMARVFQSINRAAASALIGTLRDHAAHWLARNNITAAGVSKQVALESWAALQSVAKSGWSALVAIGNYAAEAIAAAWAAISAIPFVGPFIAPAIALGAGAGIMALSGRVHSAAGGYDIPSGINPMTQLHAQEMVLPAELANRIRGMTSSGGDTHHWHLQTLDARGVKQFLMDNRDAVADAGTRAVREGRGRGRST